MKKQRLACLALTICMVFGLAACEAQEEAPKDTEEIAKENTEQLKKNNAFALPYFGSENLNPLVSVSIINHNLAYVLYEGLFQIDENFQPQPVLCESYQSVADGYILTIKSNVKFHSGKIMSADDVVFSYQSVKNNPTSAYAPRFAAVTKIEKLGVNQVKITLNKPNSRFLTLLDIPIIERGTENDVFAGGTGPFMPVIGVEDAYLAPFPNWHGGYVGSFSKINLENTNHSDAQVYSFEIGSISMLNVDRISGNSSSIHGNVLSRSIPTTGLHYFGFQTQKAPYTNPYVRQALSYAMDRTEIAKVPLQEYADPALLPVNPQPTDMELSFAKDIIRAGQSLSMGGIVDSNMDMVLDYNDANGKNHKFEPVILVNNDNPYKVAVTQKYIIDLKAMGITATMKAVPFEEFLVLLEAGDFDIYYGEVYFSPDFNPLPLFEEAGFLNYGRVKLPQLEAQLSTALTTGGVAWTEFYKGFLEQMPFMPIAFKRNQVLLRADITADFKPLPFDVFSGIEQWIVEKED